MSKLHFTEICKQFFEDPLIELILEFCVNKDTDLVDFDRVSWMNEVINYVPRIIQKDKNVSQIDFVLKGDDKFKTMRNNCKKRVDKLLELIQFALK